MSVNKLWWLAEPQRLEEDKFGCCNVCLNSQTEDCDYCNEADLFELNEEIFEDATA